MRHDFPGNVRELENIIEHAFTLARGGIIEPAHLPDYLQNATLKAGAVPAGGQTLAEIEAKVIADALARHNFKRLATARELGIDKTTLWRKMKRYGIKVPSSKRP